MEFFGGILIGAIFLFSLLAFYPFHNFDPVFSWWEGFTAGFATTQVASIGAVTPAQIKEQVERRQVFSITSPMFAEGSTTPARYTCDGVNISPALQISGVPEKTQSLVLFMEDPDIQKGTWVHWLVFNIPPTTRNIPEGKEPPGRAGKNSWGEIGYGGPCPPRSADGLGHRYFFRLYALSKVLALPQGSTKAQLTKAMKRFVLAEAELMSRYERARK